LHFVNFGRLSRNQSFSHADGLDPDESENKTRIGHGASKGRPAYLKKTR
jgi:hypothetical protein